MDTLKKNVLMEDGNDNSQWAVRNILKYPQSVANIYLAALDVEYVDNGQDVSRKVMFWVVFIVPKKIYNLLEHMKSCIKSRKVDNDKNFRKEKTERFYDTCANKMLLHAMCMSANMQDDAATERMWGRDREAGVEINPDKELEDYESPHCLPRMSTVFDLYRSIERAVQRPGESLACSAFFY